MTSSHPPRAWRDVLAEATAILGSAVDARRLVEGASGFSPAELVVFLDNPVPARAGAHLSRMVERRAAGEPLQYALGRWGFRQLDLMVDRRVLIPRPETERVADVAIAEARRLGRAAATRGQEARLTLADLGTGSGAIALSLAAELEGVQEGQHGGVHRGVHGGVHGGVRVWATDASGAALDVARANLCGLGGVAATRVRMVQGHWFDALPARLRTRLDLAVSNPPYVADDEVLPAEVADWEPAQALRAGPTGLECLAAIIAEAPSWLAPWGVLVLELAPHQVATVADLARSAGFASVSVIPDLAGRDRVVAAQR